MTVDALIRDVIALDFETHAIQKRPVYPPAPVGLAFYINDSKKQYMAFGHPAGNNCSTSDAKKFLLEVAASKRPVVFHNSAFDVAVAEEWWGVKFKDPFIVHDTLFLAFLSDPRAQTLSLKPLADKLLKMPAEEQADLRDWILNNLYTNGKDSKADPWGAHIAEAPAKLVGKYAIGDVVRTKKLFDKLYREIIDRDMVEAYRREQACRPIFENMSKAGIKVNTRALSRDMKSWQAEATRIAERVRRKLKLPKSANEIENGVLQHSFIDSTTQLADALDSQKKVLHWRKTPKGNRSTNRESMMETCVDKKLVDDLYFYGAYQLYVNTFATPWLETARNHGGRVYPSFHQVRSTDEYGSGFGGTRTGRPSSSDPNMLNVPSEKGHQIKGVLPVMRDYLVPDDGCVFLVRDYNQQELRILAHFEAGFIMQQYLENPRVDIHQKVRDMMEEVTGINWPREPVKNINFGKLYGLGATGLARKLQSDLATAKALINAHEAALPDVKGLMKGIEKHCKKGGAIRTWGGREYFVEPSKMIIDKYTGQKRKQEFYYKQLNYLIQGSAADCTKEAMIRLDATLHKTSRIAIQVYDELVVVAEKGRIKEEMEKVKVAMESIEFDVIMLSDGKIGHKNWGQTVKYKDP